MNRRRRFTRRLAPAVAAGILVLSGSMLVRALRHERVQAAVEPAPKIRIADGFAERLAGAVRIPTISPQDPDTFDAGAFRDLHAYLKTAFPRVHSQLRLEIVARHSLLYTWEGSSPKLQPILLMGHLDVVPVEPGTESDWQRAPFSGDIADGFIWGRGAIDNKSTVIGTLEAVEMLLAEGYRPSRTVYLAYGHDEEVGGTAGAQEIAALLEDRGVRLEMVLDEGGVIGQGIVPGIPAPVAMVGIAEKGFLSLELRTRTAGGHSSLPPKQSAIGILSAAIARLEQNPMPARLQAPTIELFERLAPAFPFVRRVALRNLWLTRRMVMRGLEGSPATNAMVRTTTATTMFQSGTKDNVLPAEARAVINFRVLPGDSIASVLEHVQRVIDDSRVKVRTAGRFSSEASAVSSPESESFRVLERTIRSVSPDVLVAPYLVVVVTDARHYSSLSSNIFRFLPVQLTSRDLALLHGADERISIANYEHAIRTYRQLLLNSSRDGLCDSSVRHDDRATSACIDARRR